MVSRAMIRMAIAAGALAAIGCGQSPIGPQICDRPATVDPIEYRGGRVEGDTYVSTDFDGDLLYYPGGMHYRVFHQLGEAPSDVAAELSFERFANAEDASLAPAAGNQFEIKEVDDRSITFLNGTCAQYYIRVTARR